MNRTRYLAAAALVAATLAASPADSSGQSTWTLRETRAAVELEVFRPDFSDELDFAFASSAGFLSGRLPLGTGWAVSADLPFARAGWDGITGSESSSLLGNPYLGVEWTASSELTTELGMRIPVGELDDLDDLPAILVGTAGELGRMEAFVPQTLGVYATADYRRPLNETFSLRLRGGPAFLGGDSGPDDLLVGYSGQLWYGKDRTRVGAGLAGRTNVTTDDEDVERALHQFALAGDYRIGQVRPGLQLRVPLDESVREASTYTLGITLTWAPTGR